MSREGEGGGRGTEGEGRKNIEKNAKMHQTAFPPSRTRPGKNNSNLQMLMHLRIDYTTLFALVLQKCHKDSLEVTFLDSSHHPEAEKQYTSTLNDRKKPFSRVF